MTAITIQAPAQKIWEALTTPKLIKKWFLGVDTESDWKKGSMLVHRGEYNGKPYEDKGVIVEIEPPKRLVHTHWSAGSGKPDKPENYETVTYTLKEKNGVTELSVAEANLPSEKARAASEEIWKKVLGNMKELVER